MPSTQVQWNNCTVEVWQGDITTLAVDAIVNAANPWLAGGGGVDGAIHRRGGPVILQECQAIIRQRGNKPLEAGEAVITTGGQLPARYVIHTVGPVYREWTPQQAAERLAACYRNSLALLRQQGLRSIAFPGISTGAYGYPPEEACPIAVRTVREQLLTHNACDRLIFCTFSERDYQLYSLELTRQN
ncbi:MAG: O-acetyl-ADP-ribose deacetylase [Gemmataceae bacterium]|nr:O-acetyl-ADP-ribose deacetylase [Gemmataceae bacterium]MDW8242875.1 O-acetyl-ADP-ribose deacetylase [Thermogemmata sp.]